MFGGSGRSPYLRQAPRLPVELMSLEARCEEHRPEGQCCYYAVLKAGGYGEETIERELVEFVELKLRLSPPRAPKPAPNLEREEGEGEGFIKALLKRGRRPDINRERLVDRDHQDETPPDEDYIVINGERLPLGPRKG